LSGGDALCVAALYFLHACRAFGSLIFSFCVRAIRKTEATNSTLAANGGRREKVVPIEQAIAYIHLCVWALGCVYNAPTCHNNKSNNNFGLALKLLSNNKRQQHNYFARLEFKSESK